MNMSRSILALGLVLILSMAAWAAKKERASSPAERSATKTPSQQAVTAKKSPSPPAQTTIKFEEPGLDHALLEQPATQQPSAAAAFQIPCQSVNGGGGPMSSANYSVNSSAGQSTIGFSSSASYQAGIGYWYGVSAATGCSCPFQCDYDTDGLLTALDLGSLIDVLFAGKPEETDPNCSTSRGDFDCDGFPTALDLGGLIDHLYAGGAGPCDPCNP
jgi:hypothetical protein